MVSREEKRASLQEKYQLLRSVTKSNAVNEESILVDASKYIQELQQKVEKINQDVSTSNSCPNNNYNNYETSYASTYTTNDDDDDQSLLPKVTVETLEKGFEIKVSSERSCQGLLVFILEAIEDLSLEVLDLDARVSCSDYFHLQAITQENDGVDGLDAQTVRQAVLHAIKNWSLCT